MFRKTRVYEWSYYNFSGSWAWILHRLSGLALIFYLTLHIWVIHTLTRGEAVFRKTMEFLNSTPFKLLEVGLWGVILYHAFNGIRVALVDFAKGGAVAHKKLFAVLIPIAALLWIAGGYVILQHLK